MVKILVVRWSMHIQYMLAASVAEFEQTVEVFYRVTSGSLVHDHGSGDRIYGGFLGNAPLSIITIISHSSRCFL